MDAKIEVKLRDVVALIRAIRGESYHGTVINKIIESQPDKNVRDELLAATTNIGRQLPKFKGIDWSKLRWAWDHSRTHTALAELHPGTGDFTVVRATEDDWLLTNAKAPSGGMFIPRIPGDRLRRYLRLDWRPEAPVTTLERFTIEVFA